MKTAETREAKTRHERMLPSRAAQVSSPFKVRGPEDALAPPEGLHFTHHKDMNSPPPRGATLRMAKAETRLDGLRAATRGKARSPDYSLKFC